MLAPVGCPIPTSERSLEHYVRLDVLLQGMASDSLEHCFIQEHQVSHSPMSKPVVMPHESSFLIS